MSCCQCQGLEREFNRRRVRRDLRKFRRKGVPDTTWTLLDVLFEEGVEGADVIDVGGGVGAVQLALLEEGASKATSVDASSAYEAAAREEAGRRGLEDRITYVYGDYVVLAPQVGEADIVTLDRVLCCYHDMSALVDASARRARRLYGVVYPRATWWTRAAIRLGNTYLRITRSPMRIFIHPTEAVDARIRGNGLTQIFQRDMGYWQVAVYRRT